MANYQSTHTGAEIDAGIDLLDKNAATQGQVLTANGTGGASWQNASGGGGSGGGTQLYDHVIEVPDDDQLTITIHLVTTFEFEIRSIEDLVKEPILSVWLDGSIGNCICAFDGSVLYIAQVNVVGGGFSRTLLTGITSDTVNPL